MKTSMRFDLVDLRLFLFVVEAASITHGAERAGMALASASERIREMEQSLGAPLLERHRRGVRATAAGSALAHHAQLVVQQLERMRGELSEYADGFRARVRLLANTTATAEFLPATLATFHLARHRTVLALAALRVDRHHAGAEDHPAGPDRRALVMAVFPARIDARHRG